MKIRDNLDALIEKHPQIYEAYEKFGKAVHTDGGPLDEKTRWLIKVATSSALGLEKAQLTHMAKAQAAGCSAEELEHTILLVAPTAGFPRMMEAMERFRGFLQDAGLDSEGVCELGGPATAPGGPIIVRKPRRKYR